MKWKYGKKEEFVYSVEKGVGRPNNTRMGLEMK